MSSELFTKGQIEGRPPSFELYDLDYYLGNKSDQGIQYPKDGSYLDPESDYKYKFIDILGWIRGFVPNGTVLDVGSGPSHLAYWAHKLELPFKIVGCDVSRDILRWAKEKNGLSAIVGLGHKLPFRKQAFDAVLFSDVLEHMWPKDAQRSVEQTFRILKQGGYIFINIPNRITWSDAAKRDEGHVWLPTTVEMEELLRKGNFDQASISCFTRGFPLSSLYRKVFGSDLRLSIFGRSIFIAAQKST